MTAPHEQERGQRDRAQKCQQDRGRSRRFRARITPTRREESGADRRDRQGRQRCHVWSDECDEPGHEDAERAAGDEGRHHADRRHGAHEQGRHARRRGAVRQENVDDVERALHHAHVLGAQRD